MVFLIHTELRCTVNRTSDSIIAYMIRMTTTLKTTEMYLLYYISAVNTQQIKRPDVLVQLGYTWL